MSRKIIKIISFGVIFLLLLSLLSRVFIPKNNTKKDGMINEAASGILAEKENTVDTLFVGNSVIYTSIIPMEMWKNYGITSYVLYSPGQPLEESLYFTYRASEKQKPKVIVLEASNVFFKTELSSSARNILSVIFPVFRYHDRWKTMSLDDIFGKVKHNRIDFNKGYGYSSNVKPAENSNYMIETDKEENIPKLNKIYLYLLNEYCKMNDIKLVLLAAPSIDNWNYERYNAIKNYSKENDISFVDMNLAEEIGIDWERDTRDAGDHLNYYGAKKTTEYFGKYLNELNILEDHREDKKYEGWNKSLENYNEFIEKEFGSN